MFRNTAWLLHLLVAVFVFSTLTAQPMRRTPEERVKQLKEQLSLDAKQEKKALEIFKESDTKREAMFNEMNANDDREAGREKMMKLFEETDKKIEKILTKDQKKKYEEIKKERQQRMGGRGERRN
jgi:F0F1-type ATP synthase membrane subunit b/b'